jgi:hypothetical protein
MKKLIALEELTQLAFSIYVITLLPIDIGAWVFPAFFAPDLFAVGYLLNKKVGAVMYNLAHHKSIAIILITAGFLLRYHPLTLAGFLMYAHISFDRMIGYGLKYFDSPDHTHLGFIGKARYKNVEIK